MNKAFPEWLTRKDAEGGSWTVEAGAPQRGDAWTDNTGRRMRIPVHDDEVSRVIRAHEMMHAKVSPIAGLDPAIARVWKVPERAIVVAEEFRVNMLCSHAGFDMDQLLDGSEKRSGELIGRNVDWDNGVLAVAASAGTKGCKHLLNGVKKHNPDMAKALREVEKRLLKEWRDDLRSYGTSSIADTTSLDVYDSLTEQYISSNHGFSSFTSCYANIVAKALRSVSSSDDESVEGAPSVPGLEKLREVLKGDGSRSRGAFAPLLLRDDFPLSKRVDGRLGRKRVASAIGKNPKRLNRMLTDPERRVFDRRARASGGVVLIDQSGSMHLSDDDIWRIIEQAPGCVIIGYSHEAGSHTVPNVWVMADRGKVCESVPGGNGGNGVDGPAVQFAQTHRRHGEPFVWVCDGIVTDGEDDDTYTNLDVEAIELVTRHGIHMVENVDEAVEALSKAAKGDRLPTKLTGRLANTYDRATAD